MNVDFYSQYPRFLFTIILDIDVSMVRNHCKESRHKEIMKVPVSYKGLISALICDGIYELMEECQGASLTLPKALIRCEVTIDFTSFANNTNQMWDA